MKTVTLDTLAFSDYLKEECGFTEAHAKKLSAGLDKHLTEAVMQKMVTKNDLELAVSDLTLKMNSTMLKGVALIGFLMALFKFI